MPEYDFTATISGTVVAADEDEARMLIKTEPGRWGQVEIEDFDLGADWVNMNAILEEVD